MGSPHLTQPFVGVHVAAVCCLLATLCSRLLGSERLQPRAPTFPLAPCLRLHLCASGTMNFSSLEWLNHCLAVVTDVHSLESGKSSCCSAVAMPCKRVQLLQQHLVAEKIENVCMAFPQQSIMNYSQLVSHASNYRLIPSISVLCFHDHGCTFSCLEHQRMQQ